MKPLKALQRFKERQAEGQLDARGLSIRDHYRKWHPKFVKKLEREGKAEEFFLRRQEGYYDLEEELKQKRLPAGGAQEILQELYYPLSEEETRILRS